MQRPPTSAHGGRAKPNHGLRTRLHAHHIGRRHVPAVLRVSGRSKRPMNTPARLVRCAAFLAVAGGATSALAQDSYDGPVVGVNLSEGPRWGPGAAPAETVGGAGLFGGWRWENVRLGLFGQTSWWQGSH